MTEEYYQQLRVFMKKAKSWRLRIFLSEKRIRKLEKEIENYIINKQPIKIELAKEHIAAENIKLIHAKEKFSLLKIPLNDITYENERPR